MKKTDWKKVNFDLNVIPIQKSTQNGFQIQVQTVKLKLLEGNLGPLDWATSS
jgi:hypothetical protein